MKVHKLQQPGPLKRTREESLDVDVTEEGASRPAEPVFHEREVATEESMGSIELLAVLRIRSSRRLAILVRREHETGFVLEWIERSPRGWNVRWRSATDGC